MRIFPLLALSTAFLFPQTALPQEPILEYSREPKVVVISMKIRGAMLAAPNPEGIPRLRVYGDGRALVYNGAKPESQKYSELRLSDNEMDELLQFLYDHGGMEHEYGVVKEEARRVRLETRIPLPGGAFRHTRGAIIDAAHTEIQISLTKFQKGGSAEEVRTDFTHRTGGYGLSYMAKEYPEVKEARDLAAIEARLLELVLRPGKRKATAPPEDFLSDDVQP